MPGSHLRTEAEIIHQFQDDASDEEDNIPLAQLLHIPKKLKSCSWMQSDLEPEIPEWREQNGPSNMSTPLQLFESFFDVEVINLIVSYSNIYAANKNLPADITTKEIKCFLGVLLVSGYVVHPYRYMYWENRNDTQNKIVVDAISRDRFSYIMKVLHVCDNNSLEEKDKYAKLRPLFSLINKKFIEFANVEENHSIDEAMIPYYGRHPCKQFIRGKPIRWGYKFWVGTLRLGYILWFSPYQGASNTLPNKYKELGLGSSVILSYADVLQNQWPGRGFHLYFDNFFTSLHLVNELKKRHLFGTGTIRDNRLLNCPFTSVAAMKKTIRGQYEYKLDQDTGIVVCRWNDNSVVTVASNYTTVLPVSQVKRFSQKEKRHVNINQPKVIKSYNTYMGGVDRSDQNISLYRVSIRGKKWYFPLFAHCLDMSVQNAWQIHRLEGGKMNQVHFRRAVATNLLESNQSNQRRGPSKRNSLANIHSRYDGLNHLVIYQELQARCGFCHKKVQFRCEKCEVPLHPKYCFKSYHTE